MTSKGLFQLKLFYGSMILWWLDPRNWRKGKMGTYLHTAS